MFSCTRVLNTQTMLADIFYLSPIEQCRVIGNMTLLNTVFSDTVTLARFPCFE